MRKRFGLALAMLLLAFAVATPVGIAAASVASGPASQEASEKDEKPSKKEKKAKKAELLKSAKPLMWREPSNIASLDFVAGPGGSDGAPVPPFTFIEEKFSGTAPKIDVRDARGRVYGVKFGDEVKSEVVATRIAWAAGYPVEPTYYVANGKIEGVKERKRTKYVLDSDGRFEEARFELKLDDLGDFEDKNSWRFDENPFVGSPELNGLKTVMMVTSNWDNKDQKDAFRGSNTKIILFENGSNVEARYMVTDWGASMGRYGGFFARNKWDPEGYATQSPEFVSKAGNQLEWEYQGQYGKTFWSSVKPEHATWVANYLDKITDEQLRSVVLYVNGTPQDAENIVKGFRQRVQQLKTLR